MKSSENYSLTRILLHWLIACVFIVLFISGYWMVDLDYYHNWYTKAPYAHKALGILLAFVVVLATITRALTKKPNYEQNLSVLEKRSAKLVQLSMSILVYLLLVTGYLITTAKGDSINVFGWFEIPAIFSDLNSQNDLTGKLHRLYSIISLKMILL